MWDIVAIGSTTRDNFLKANYKLIDWPETPLKKAIVLPFGEKIGVDEIYKTIGGNSANASVTFTRQGFKTACVAELGTDLEAKAIKEQLEKEGVYTKLITYSKEKPTAFSVLLLQDGERTILGYHGASDTLTLKDLNLKKLKARWWYISLAGESDAMLADLVNFARENGIKVAFNPSGHHIKHKRQEILAVLKDVAFLVLNAGEAAELVGIPFEREQEVFRKLDELTPGIVAVTNGDKGVTVSDGKNRYKARIFPEQVLADRTGAGDAFGSGFVAGLMGREDRRSSVRNDRNAQLDQAQRSIVDHRTFDAENILYAIRLATANAASVVEHIGATEGILTKEEFEKNERWQNLPIASIPIY